MKLKKIKKKIESKIQSEIEINEVTYNPGHWISTRDNGWVTKRIYVTSDTDKREQLEGIIEKLNETIPTNTQIILK